VSEAEAREIVRVLLEREVPRSTDGSEVFILLGPNTNAGWIPQIAGISIRKLKYEEQKLVSEYYDLSASVKGNAIEIALLKGNYCRKAGRRYQFRRGAEISEPKEIGYSETTALGSGCDGCVVGSGAVYTVKNQFPSTEPQVVSAERREQSLVLNGVVDTVSCYRDEGQYVQCKADLKLKVTNAAVTPVIILQQTDEHKFWHGGTSLALSEKESRARTFIYDLNAWQSFHTGSEYRDLAELLDKPVPPDKLTRVLSTGESWRWDATIQLRFLESNSCNQHVGVEIGWKEVKKLSAPLWLRVSFELWPFNVENFKPNLGSDLKKRWQRLGSLYVSDDSERFSHAILTSEPIEIQLSRVELNDPRIQN
jgi:hypothetical protein